VGSDREANRAEGRLAAAQLTALRNERRAQTGDFMFEDYTPKHKIGCLSPLAVVENAAYEFYRLAPPGLMLVLIPIGLAEFSRADVERVFAPLESYLDMLKERGVDMVMQNGVPLPLLIGIEAHDRMIDHMAKYSGVPATSTVLSVGRAARQLGLKKVAFVNKWSDEMNRTLGEFMAREGVSVCGVANKSLKPAEFIKISAEDQMQLAYELGRRAFQENADCDGVYIGGGTWLAEPVAEQLEEEFGKPVICNQAAMIRDILHILGDWKPIEGHCRVLSAP
jgi:maleate isomerase